MNPRAAPRAAPVKQQGYGAEGEQQQAD